MSWTRTRPWGLKGFLRTRWTGMSTAINEREREDFILSVLCKETDGKKDSVQLVLRFSNAVGELGVCAVQFCENGHLYPVAELFIDAMV